MIIRPQLEPTDEQSVLSYYINSYPEVHIITCNKCKEDIGIEVLSGDIGHIKANANGYVVLPFGDRLLSSRVRTDGVMGYQCVCGNDTRGNQVEERISPDGTFLPHEVAAIQTEYELTGYKQPITHRGKKEYHDKTFIRERIK